MAPNSTFFFFCFKIIIDNYNFYFKFKIRYDGFKIIVNNYGFKFKIKIIIINYDKK